MSETSTLREDAAAIFRAALAAADAAAAVRLHLHRSEFQLRVGSIHFSLDRIDRVVVVAVGKAAPQMAEAIEQRLGAYFSKGLVITKQGHAKSYKGPCQVIESSHPVPDEESFRAGKAVFGLLNDLTPKD